MIKKELNIERFTLSLALVISSVLHIISILIFVAERKDSPLPDEWVVDFFILISLSIATMIGMYLYRGPYTRILLALIRGSLFLLIGIPFKDFMDIEYLLLISVILDYCFLFPSLLGAFLSLGLLGISLFLQFPMSVYMVESPGRDITDLILYLMFGVLFTVVFSLVRFLKNGIESAQGKISNLDDIVSRLIGANRGYLEYASRVEQETTESERTRIIQELHDIVGKSFVNIYAMMEASLNHPPETKSDEKELHSWVKEQAQLGLTETRAVLYELNEKRVSDPGGLRALNNLISTFREATKVEVNVSWGNSPWRFRHDADLVIRQVVQESLVNAFRHGKSTIIDIKFWLTGNEFTLDIADNGVGGKAKKKGIGQSSMERRVTDIGGRIQFRNTGTGYRINMAIPLHKVAHNE